MAGPGHEGPIEMDDQEEGRIQESLGLSYTHIPYTRWA